MITNPEKPTFDLGVYDGTAPATTSLHEAIGDEAARIVVDGHDAAVKEIIERHMGAGALAQASDQQ